MRNFIQFLIKYHIFFFFLGLQVLCFWLLVRNNSFHEASFINSSNRLVGGMLQYKSNLTAYIELQRVNDELSVENELLRNQLSESFINVNDHFVMINDTLRERKFRYKSAQVINSTVRKQLNYLTINKGSKDGIAPEMGVINTQGLVGVVKDVSAHFATVIPIINLTFTASAEIKRTGHFGLLRWDGKDYRYAQIHDIPGHVNIVLGDTIVTRGSSAIYPNGIPIGVVEDIDQKTGSNFHHIKILLNNDFRKLRYVNVVDNLLKEEQKLIEGELINAQ